MMRFLFFTVCLDEELYKFGRTDKNTHNTCQEWAIKIIEKWFQSCTKLVKK